MYHPQIRLDFPGMCSDPTRYFKGWKYSIWVIEGRPYTTVNVFWRTPHHQYTKHTCTGRKFQKPKLSHKYSLRNNNVNVFISSHTLSIQFHTLCLKRVTFDASTGRSVFSETTRTIDKTLCMSLLVSKSLA